MNKNYVYFNPNPAHNFTNDCVIRALCKALDSKWEAIKAIVDVYSMLLYQSEDADIVWFDILADRGFEMIPLYCKGNKCTVSDFCETHKEGTYVLKVANHVVCVKDGRYFDSWNSGDEIPLYCWFKG